MVLTRSEDEEVKEVEAPWVLRKKGSVMGMAPGKSKLSEFLYVQIT